MKLLRLIPLYFALPLLISTFSAKAATRTWDGGAGTLVWTSAANWSGDVVPVTGDDIIFSTAGTFTITAVPTLSINSLTVSSGTTVTLSGGSPTTLTIGGNAGTDLTIAASISLVLNGLNVTLASNATANISGSLTINNSCTFNSDGTSVITTVSTGGAIVNSGTLTCTSSSKLVFNGTATYTHSQNGGTVPTATWNGTSTCTITGVTNTMVSGITSTSNTFMNFVWNCTGETTSLNMVADGSNFTCNGDFTISSTGGSTYILSFSGAAGAGTSVFTVGGSFYCQVTGTNEEFDFISGSTSVTATITGSLNVSGGLCYAQKGTGTLSLTVGSDLNQSGGSFIGIHNSGTTTINIGGNLLASGGIFRMTGNAGAVVGDPTYNISGNITTSGTVQFFCSRSAGANPTVNVTGNVDFSVGTVSAAGAYTSTTSVVTFNFTGGGSSTLKLPTGLNYDAQAVWSWVVASGKTLTLLSNVELGGTGNSCVFTNNGTLICDTYTFPAITNAVASVVIANGSTIKTAHTQGLSTTASTGTIQVSGTKTFHSGATYVFNGTSAQVTGNFGVSASTANTVAALEFNNSAGVTLSANLTVNNSGTLTLTSGYHDLASYTLQLGVSGATTLSVTAGGLYSSSNTGSYSRYIPTGLGATGVSSSSTPYYGLFPFKKSSTELNVMELNNTSAVTTAGTIKMTPEFSSTIVDVPDYNDDHGTIEQIKNGKAVTITLSSIAGGTFSIQNTSGNFSSGVLSDYSLQTYTGSTTGYQGSYSATTGTVTNPTVIRTGVSTANLAQRWVVGTYNYSATSLPVSLLQFSAYAEGSNNRVIWKTQLEINNDFFTVEKLTSDQYFMPVGNIDGAGNTNAETSYSLLDSDVENRINVYRLKQTDYNGTYTYSPLVSVDNTMDRDKITRTVVYRANLLGQEVNDGYKGIQVIYFSDGTRLKYLNQ